MFHIMKRGTEEESRPENKLRKLDPSWLLSCSAVKHSLLESIAGMAQVRVQDLRLRKIEDTTGALLELIA
jgi:hypothetical protein